MKEWAAAHATRLGTAALVITILAMALPIQTLDHTCAQTSTFALVRSLRDGTAQIDRYQAETCDKSFRNGHFYSNKAPGLAFVILPAYTALDATGLLPDRARTTYWLLSLWSSVLPAAIMLLLVRRIATRFDPATGTLVAVAVGLASLTLPLATLDFGHLLAVTLLLAAFAIAFAERHAGGRIWPLLAAGIFAGYAVTTEYPAALAASVIGLYALTASRPVQRAAAFGLGGLIGLLPLLAYDHWAFGSAKSISYGDAVKNTTDGTVAVGAHDSGFYGVLLPSFSAAMRILVSNRGLLVVTPIVVAGVVGLVLLARRGFKAEALALGAISAGMLTYNASLTISWGWVYGGDAPGPRYLYLAVPFALLPLGLVFREAPAVVAALVTVSFLWMGLATATQPLVGNEGPAEWLRLLRLARFTETPLSLFGLGSGWIAVSPLALVLVAAFATLVTAAAGIPRRSFSAAVFATTVGAWAFVVLAGHELVLARSMTATFLAFGILLTGCLLVLTAMKVAHEGTGEVTPWTEAARA